jgi:PPOX class probable F420-dependent enzyme
MDLDEARTFLRENTHGVVATYRRDGSTQLSPVLVAVDDGGRVMISTRETAFKVAHLRRDPRVSVLVVPDSWFGAWVQVDGTATIISLPEAMDLLVDLYRHAMGEHPNWDEYREAMTKDQRCIIAVTIERAGPDRRG